MAATQRLGYLRRWFTSCPRSIDSACHQSSAQRAARYSPANFQQEARDRIKGYLRGTTKGL